MHEASAARAISPPNASISRTRCPFAVPPIAGLHGILPTASRLIEKHRVFSPRRAHANAASMPACPAPITATSYSPAKYKPTPPKSSEKRRGKRSGVLLRKTIASAAQRRLFFSEFLFDCELYNNIIKILNGIYFLIFRLCTIQQVLHSLWITLCKRLITFPLCAEILSILWNNLGIYVHIPVDFANSISGLAISSC